MTEDIPEALKPNNRPWIDLGAGQTNCNLQEHLENMLPMHITHFQWELVQNTLFQAEDLTSPLRFFSVSFPFEFFVQVVVPNTNASLHRAKLLQTNLDEILKYIGIRLMMVRMRLDKLSDYWSETPVSFYDAPHFGLKYGMTRNRFLQINKHLTFWPATETNVSVDISNLHDYSTVI